MQMGLADGCTLAAARPLKKWFIKNSMTRSAVLNLVNPARSSTTICTCQFRMGGRFTMSLTFQPTPSQYLAISYVELREIINNPYAQAPRENPARN
jgi:hypothetical protein